MYIKSIALPREHGAWGYVLEPLVLGLLVAFSVKGLCLAVGALLAFMAHQPVRIFFSAQQRAKRPAFLFILLYGIPALAFFALFVYKTDLYIFLPFIFALLFMVIYLILDLSGFNRKMITRLISPTAIDLIAVSIVLASGWGLVEAAAFFILLLSRAHPTTFYVRAKLRQKEVGNYYDVLVVTLHLLALFATGFFVYLKHIPWLALIAVFMLFVRAVYGIYFNKINRIPKQVGIREFVFGILFVFISAAGYIFKI